MPQLGPLEILVVLVVALLVFGPRRLPEIGRQVGAALRELRNFQHEVRGHLSSVVTEDASDRQQPPPTLPPKEGGRPASAPVVPARPAPGRFHAPRPVASAPSADAGASPSSEGTARRAWAAPARPAPTRFRPPQWPAQAAHAEAAVRDLTSRRT